MAGQDRPGLPCRGERIGALDQIWEENTDFAFRGVGPSENQLMTGGTFAFLNTVEYQMPLLANDKLFFVTFLDHGTVEKNVGIKDYRVSAGFGFRMAVPALGPLPIAIDFAFPLNRAAWDNRQVFSFYVGLFGGQ